MITFSYQSIRTHFYNPNSHSLTCCSTWKHIYRCAISNGSKRLIRSNSCQQICGLAWHTYCIDHQILLYMTTRHNIYTPPFKVLEHWNTSVHFSNNSIFFSSYLRINCKTWCCCVVSMPGEGISYLIETVNNALHSLQSAIFLFYRAWEMTRLVVTYILWILVST